MREQLTQRPFHYMGVLTLTVSGTVVGIAASSIPPGASGAVVANAVGAGDVHWLVGSDPSTAFGVPLKAGDALVFRDNPTTIQNLRFIRVGSSDGRVTVHFLTE